MNDIPYLYVFGGTPLKKALVFIIILSFLFSFTGCKEEDTRILKIGLVTLASANDNALTKEILNSLEEASMQYGCSYEHYKVDGQDYTFDSIAYLYEHGCRIIIATEYSFSSAIKTAQKEYTDCIFICLGFALANPADNTINITFSDHEAGFIAGIAAALKLQNGKVGGIFGMDIPSARRYSNGFTFGISYANQQLGTSVTINESDVIFIGSYNDPKLAKKLADDLYNSEVKCILTDGGNTSNGVLQSAKALRSQYPDIWVIGTNTDTYQNGLFIDNYSVVLTSAINKYNIVISNIINSYLNDSIEGGRIINFSMRENAIGLPDNNPNLSSDIFVKCNEVIELVKEGKIVIPDTENLLN